MATRGLTQSAGSSANSLESVKHLKETSRVKHRILQNYLPGWESILGSAHRRLSYVDCYAGPGVYEFDGELVGGSPLIAIQTALDYVKARKSREIDLTFVENDAKNLVSLNQAIKRLGVIDPRVSWRVEPEDAVDFVPTLLRAPERRVPSFFFVDPYGHPLTIPILNKILSMPRTEVLINVMYFRISMDAENPVKSHLVDEMFGDTGWHSQPFVHCSGTDREDGFLDYFRSQLKCRFTLPFRIRFDAEDPGSHTRTKYYLVHASNHIKAALLMKQVMWPLGDEDGMFDYSGRRMGTLFSRSPSEDELERFLIERFGGREMGFDELREETWELPFIEKHYRSVIKRLEAADRAKVRRISSKATGVAKNDRVTILR